MDKKKTISLAGFRLILKIIKGELLCEVWPPPQLVVYQVRGFTLLRVLPENPVWCDIGITRKTSFWKDGWLEMHTTHSRISGFHILGRLGNDLLTKLVHSCKWVQSLLGVLRTRPCFTWVQSSLSSLCFKWAHFLLVSLLTGPLFQMASILTECPTSHALFWMGFIDCCWDIVAYCVLFITWFGWNWKVSSHED